MTSELRPAEGLLGQMTMLRIETDGAVVHLRLNRPDKRNALNETLVRELQTAFVRKSVETGVAQVKDFQAASTKAAEEVAKPLKVVFEKTINELKVA